MEGAGWFADPRPRPTGDAGGYRWWDGTQWTAWIADRLDAPPPPLESSSTGPPPESAPAPPPRSEPAASAGPPDDRPVRVPVAVAATVATLAFALLAVGATVSATDRETADGPPMAPPTPASSATLSFRSESREVQVGGLTMTMPAAPWRCDSSPRTVKNFFSSGVVCSAEVPDAAQPGKTNYVNVVTGVVADNLVRSDPATTTQGLQDQVRQLLFNQPVTVTDVRTPTTPYGPVDRVARQQAVFSFRVKGVVTRYDIDILVVRLDSGQSAAVIFDLSDNLSPALRRTVDAANGSIAVS